MKKYVDTNANEIFFEDEKTGKIYDENMHEVYENITEAYIDSAFFDKQ